MPEKKKRPRVNYDEFTVTCNGEPSKEALTNYYNILTDFLIQKFGRESVLEAMRQLIEEDEE
jgi:hypothetical protein